MGYVYIGKGKNDTAFKIGRTNGLETERLKQHRTASPSFEFYLTIETKAPIKTEKHVHDLFEDKRVPGTKEWFALDPSAFSHAQSRLETYEHETLPLLSQVEEFKSKESSSVYIEADSTTDRDYQKLRELKAERLRIEQEEERIECRLKLKIGLNAGIKNFISWESESQNRFNNSLFQQDHFDLYEAYLRSSIRRCFRLF